MFLMVLGVIIFLIWAYILFIREWLVNTFPGGKIQWWHEQIEDRLWQGSRTILTSLGYVFGGLIIAVHELAAAYGLDATPIINELAAWIPEQYRGLAIAILLFLTGFAFAWLRKVTTGPVGSSLKEGG